MCFSFIRSELTVDQLLVEIAQHIHQVFTGFFWQDLPREGSLIFIAGKGEAHSELWRGWEARTNMNSGRAGGETTLMLFDW